MNISFSRYQCGFRKGHSVRYCLLTMIEKYDLIPYDLIIAKLEAYGFHKDSLQLIHDYLSNRMQRVKVHDSYRSWKHIFYVIPQGSILGPLLFNKNLSDLFYILENLDIASNVDDSKRKKEESVIRALETSYSLLFGWFNSNFMKANSGERHLILRFTEATTAIINGFPNDSSKTEVLLGITINQKLNLMTVLTIYAKKNKSKT